MVRVANLTSTLGCPKVQRACRDFGIARTAMGIHGIIVVKSIPKHWHRISQYPCSRLRRNLKRLEMQVALLEMADGFLFSKGYASNIAMQRQA